MVRNDSGKSINIYNSWLNIDMPNQDELYMLKSKQNIDICIYNNEYKKAFGLLVMVLERLEEDQKKTSLNIIVYIYNTWDYIQGYVIGLSKIYLLYLERCWSSI